MTDATVRLIQNSRAAFKRFSWEQLYQVTLSLRDELAFRDVDCQPEADALVAALLVHARTEHRTIYAAEALVPAPAEIFGADCTGCEFPAIAPPAE